jgi:hypothetical protein
MIYIEMGSLKLNCKVTWGYSNSKYRYMGLKDIHVEDYQHIVQNSAYSAAETPMCMDIMFPKQILKRLYSAEKK